MSNGVRKYKLNKDLNALRQNTNSLSEYYTHIKGIWEELDATCDLPRISDASEEVNNFLQVLAKQKEEQKPF